MAAASACMGTRCETRICECLLGFRGVRSAGRCDATSLPTAVYWNLRGFDNFCSTAPGRGWAPPWAPRNRTLDKYATGPPDTRRLSTALSSISRTHCLFPLKQGFSALGLNISDLLGRRTSGRCAAHRLYRMQSGAGPFPSPHTGLLVFPLGTLTSQAFACASE